MHFLIRYIFLGISVDSLFLTYLLCGDRMTYYRNLEDINPLFDSGGEGELNKKKQVFQSQLPWYTTEVAAQAREVDGNQKTTRETLTILQKDLSFAE